jgi:hypothetical protein
MRVSPVVLLLGCASPEPGSHCELPETTIVDPQTGNCVPTGTDSCGVTWNVPTPDWPICGGACTGNDPTTCAASAACHVVVVADHFDSCWDVPISGAIQGPCTGLAADACAHHDDCASVFRIALSPESEMSYVFDHCDSEP